MNRQLFKHLMMGRQHMFTMLVQTILINRSIKNMRSLGCAIPHILLDPFIRNTCSQRNDSRRHVFKKSPKGAKKQGHTLMRQRTSRDNLAEFFKFPKRGMPDNCISHLVVTGLAHSINLILREPFISFDLFFTEF
ncbi:hypothetical protein SAMN04490184_5687 [Pseudomonas extremorientalis]|uniref:Uncharacterized protein n=1 Tax=Pseudomonas extremorientalis TaxID=169669 RepID=A0ABY0T4A3_9PSED|nr:hypothetical protein SAMN04490184_5687 [Pseudomonas extremorientalis]